MNQANQQIQQAITALKNGNLIGYPTESVYGFGADPFNETAIQKLQDLKARPKESAFLMIATDFNQIEKYIDCDDTNILKKIKTPSIHPTTWVCPASNLVPEFLWGPNKTIAIRITDFPLCVQLCEYFGGPIISTSANFKGEAAAKNFTDMQKFAGKLAFMINAPCGTATRPSTIKDLLTDAIYRA
jgi:L-threonylcarbamoyladenylate synthase